MLECMKEGNNVHVCPAIDIRCPPPMTPSDSFESIISYNITKSLMCRADIKIEASLCFAAGL
jgi:hypothetical protein